MGETIIGSVLCGISLAMFVKIVHIVFEIVCRLCL